MYPIRVRSSALIIENESILLVEFHDENGLHYNLPGGGVEPFETVVEAAKREAKEEASIDVDVTSLAFVYEYAPQQVEARYGETPSLTLFFDCKRKGECTPKMSSSPDPNQTGVKWIPLDQLDQVVLYPNIHEHIKSYVRLSAPLSFIEEEKLPVYK
ncbi:NUDIX domain-containing protein [Priestia koreensis]|uniref:NUDIX domain-containing protein n=1 Tax=Priestia koreensis TaxID=284581 RepID=UPI001F58925D|nr:NUDIX domain-containing protein [Priestia koreensis]UNL83122.1 NUDIX domain-containing protein [Priestia koreensis]